MKPLLTVEDLHVRYGEVEVLKGVCLEVFEGQIVSLVGANGAGKTTALMAVSGLVPASGGRILFDGEDVTGMTPEKIVARGITHVPEGRRVFPRMSVKENLMIGAFASASRRNGGGDLDRVFALFPALAGKKNQLAGTLSGGEQQMLALGRGLMARPRVLLLDEPSLGLAPKLVLQVFEVIRQIHRAGTTILLVEQNAYQALRAADAGYVLETGKIVLKGPAAQLRENPAIKEAYLGG